MKNVKSNCLYDFSPRYKTLTDAKQSCNGAKWCTGVQDQFCGRSTFYYLCKSEIDPYSTSKNGMYCTHTKIKKENTELNKEHSSAFDAKLKELEKEAKILKDEVNDLEGTIQELKGINILE